MNNLVEVKMSGNGCDNIDVGRWERTSRFMDDKFNEFCVRKEDTDLVIESGTTKPEGPAVMSYGVINTKEKYFNPGLKGTNIFEIDFKDYTNNGEYINKYMTAIGHESDVEDPEFGLYLIGWGITIGNIKGFVGGKDDADRKRGVQFHFDHYSKWGFGSCLNRQISTGDINNYPRFTQEELMMYMDDIYLGKKTPYRSMDDATVLSARHYMIDERSISNFGGIKENSWGRRYGIMLSNDGNTFSWMLDGMVMDSCDITGYFSSSTDDFKDGVYISIGGGAGFRKNQWKFSNPRIYVSAVET